MYSIIILWFSDSIYIKGLGIIIQNYIFNNIGMGTIAIIGCICN